MFINDWSVPLNHDTYDGIDYGRGLANVDRATGIRYGVIAANEVGQAWYDSSEADYGTPTCPTCGGALVEFADETADGWTIRPHEIPEYACVACRLLCGGESAFSEEPLAHTYTGDGYTAEQTDSDIFVTASPFYTRGTFCSPCAPGAVSLGTGGSIRAYCFGHDWFEDGRAPYRLWRVSDDTEVVPDAMKGSE
jgi:hypothetical protein